ncbi:MAG TPA: polysaccharide deacetylase family protein [Chthonomonadaceae bacterium]|nr:polysaccharide deacetylase family protein [Chthonomonadaceae bacterium]
MMTFGLALGGLCVAACALSWHGFTLMEWVRESRSGVVLYRANTRARVVALTFDDGPDPIYTPRILAILRRYGVRATFFEVGRQVRAYPQVACRVVAAGHVVGNHTWSHPYLERKSARGVHGEMEAGEITLEKTLRLKSHLFRPPRGAWNPVIFREARREGDHIILWTVALEHHDAPTPRAMVARALRLVRPGSILLLHDGAHVSRERTVEALPLLLDGLRRRGYRCVTIPQLLHIRGDDPVKTT